MNQIQKQELLRTIYHTGPGQMLWRKFSCFVNSEIGKRIVRKAYEESRVIMENIPDKNFIHLPRIPAVSDSSRPAALLVMPFFGQNAASECFLSHCRALKKCGWHVIALFYLSKYWKFHSESWDECYSVVSNNPRYECQVFDSNGKVIDDGHRLDDWCGDDLIQFAASLATLRNIRLVMVNYVFLSRVLEYLPDTMTKMIFTHDIMSTRNSRMRRCGFSEQAFYFSTSPKEEATGLNRADLVIAIQKKEADYFSSVVSSNVRVKTLSMIPPDNTATASDKFKMLPSIGYFASGHGPNITALKRFLSEYCRQNPVFIGGSICDHLKNTDFDSRFRLLGRVETPEDFYHRCDLIVNPDEFESGFKIKSIEALSFGKPLVCTKAAAIGLNSTSKYHNARDINDLMILLNEALSTQEELKRMRFYSIERYRSLAREFDSAMFFSTIQQAQK